MLILQLSVAQTTPEHLTGRMANQPKRAAERSWIRYDIFSGLEVAAMKSFFIKNAAKPLQPANSLWNPRYKQACINTVRAGLEILLYGNSDIPDSLFSNRDMFNCFGQKNTIDVLMQKLEDSGYVSKKTTIGFAGINRGVMAPIDSARGYLAPDEMSGSLWHTMLGMIGPVKGWSVFVISLCSGTHTAVLSVDHTGADDMMVFWSDQTNNHLVSPEDRVPPYSRQDQWGWEWMNKSGTLETNPRGLDAYVLYAMKTYWCDCKYLEVKDPPRRGICFPEIRLWRITRKY